MVYKKIISPLTLSVHGPPKWCTLVYNLIIDVKELIMMLVGETEPRSLAKSEMIKGAYK